MIDRPSGSSCVKDVWAKKVPVVCTFCFSFCLDLMPLKHVECKEGPCQQHRTVKMMISRDEKILSLNFYSSFPGPWPSALADKGNKLKYLADTMCSLKRVVTEEVARSSLLQNGLTWMDHYVCHILLTGVLLTCILLLTMIFGRGWKRSRFDPWLVVRCYFFFTLITMTRLYYSY